MKGEFTPPVSRADDTEEREAIEEAAANERIANTLEAFQARRERRNKDIPGYAANGIDVEAVSTFDRDVLRWWFKTPQFELEFRMADHKTILALLVIIAQRIQESASPYLESLPDGILGRLNQSLMRAKEGFNREIIAVHLARAMLPFLVARGVEERKHPEWFGDRAAYAIWKNFTEQYLPHLPPTTTQHVVQLYRHRGMFPAEVRNTFSQDISATLDPEGILTKKWSAIRDVPTFLELFGEDGLAAFESVQWSTEARGAIFDIARQLDSGVAKKLFHAYAELTREADRAHEILEEAFPNARSVRGSQGYALMASVWGALKERATRLLTDAARQVRTREASYDRDESSPDGALKVSFDDIADRLGNELAIIRVLVVARATTYRLLAERGLVNSLEDISGFEMQTIDAHELTDRKREQMKAIFSANRSGYPERLRGVSDQQFDEALNGSGRFYVLEFGGAIVAFMRFEERPDGSLYAGSLNVRPEARGSMIGTAMLREVLAESGRDRDIVAEVYAKNPMLKHYQEDWGFEITGEVPNWHGSGEMFYEMRRKATHPALKAA